MSLPLEVTEGVFPVTRITVDEEKVKLSPEDEKRADREEARLKALWELKTERLWSGGFLIPLRNSYSTLFGTKRIFNNEKESVHSGLDIRGRHGESVWASNRGRVVVAEELFFGGNTVVLDHGLGIYTIYMHLSEIKVAVDDIVEKGKVVGLVGSTGRSTGPHLHFSVKIGSTSTNPLAMTKLPLFGL
ncbi:MAG: M23 family metallopeptidase [Phycisphaerae bacterium]|nr:M23 family metallopeptidase [Phycisphaerae bacterium]NIP50950.1 M23 family metallopeptidase [Phycisphaerae bacterium]NIW41591.1 peptidoglycan DD-metalloendopeptidase family protein [candidate division Zixibacteria bacterium]NIW97340.1 peptidoglycan DD-metalloendopeptidase family protein [Phycisphaerae bacterium]NIX26782.1 peptidoglycan DD-metalloendopeptidase family protein [Phycisphaerae bacterium]